MAYPAHKFMADAKIGCNVNIGKPLRQQRILFDEIKIALIRLYAQVLNHTTLQGHIETLRHYPEKFFYPWYMIISVFFIILTYN